MPVPVYLSLVVLPCLVVMEDTVTLTTQVATVVTQDQGLRLVVIVVVTKRLKSAQTERH